MTCSEVMSAATAKMIEDVHPDLMQDDSSKDNTPTDITSIYNIDLKDELDDIAASVLDDFSSIFDDCRSDPEPKETYSFKGYKTVLNSCVDTLSCSNDMEGSVTAHFKNPADKFERYLKISSTNGKSYLDDVDVEKASEPIDDKKDLENIELLKELSKNRTAFLKSWAKLIFIVISLFGTLPLGGLVIYFLFHYGGPFIFVGAMITAIVLATTIPFYFVKWLSDITDDIDDYSAKVKSIKRKLDDKYLSNRERREKQKVKNVEAAMGSEFAEEYQKIKGM